MRCHRPRLLWPAWSLFLLLLDAEWRVSATKASDGASEEPTSGIEEVARLLSANSSATTAAASLVGAAEASTSTSAAQSTSLRSTAQSSSTTSVSTTTAPPSSTSVSSTPGTTLSALAAPKTTGVPAAASKSVSVPTATSKSVSVEAPCDAADKPALWSLRQKDQTAFVLGIAHAPLVDMEPISDPVKEALGCADIVYFQLPCSVSSYGSFFEHCGTYPVVDPDDSMAVRLPKKDLKALEQGAQRLLNHTAPGCAAAAGRFKKATASLGDERNRTTLTEYHQQALRTLDASGCKVADGERSYEDWLRTGFAGRQRPVFGLEDVTAKCRLIHESEVAPPAKEKKQAQQLADRFSQPEWAANMTALQNAQVRAAKCGDFSGLPQGEVHNADVPTLSKSILSTRTSKLVKAMKKAIGQHSGKTLLFAIGVEHTADLAGAKGVVSQLQSDGFTAERLGTGFSCTASTFTAPGSQELQKCFDPVDKQQPASCDNFRLAFNKELEGDPMYGRTKSSADCAECIGSDDACTCHVRWENQTDFQELCENTTVDGVSGKVWQLDLTRNPHSTRKGKEVAQKQVIGLYRNCYATSCNMELLQETERRMWHSSDSSLSVGKVYLRLPGGDEKGELHVPKWLQALGIGSIVASILAVLMCHFLRVPCPCHRYLGYGHDDEFGVQPSPREPFAHGHVKGRGLGGSSFAHKIQSAAYSNESGSEDDGPPPTPPPPPGKEWRRSAKPEDPMTHDDPFHRQLLTQAIQMKAALSVAGHNALQHMNAHGQHGLQQSVMESMRPPSFAGYVGGGPPSVRYEQLSQVQPPGSPTSFSGGFSPAASPSASMRPQWLPAGMMNRSPAMPSTSYTPLSQDEQVPFYKSQH